VENCVSGNQTGGNDPSQPQQARELLAPVYGWFPEGFDTGDLNEAKALLKARHRQLQSPLTFWRI
jgi:hypothetical protein